MARAGFIWASACLGLCLISFAAARPGGAPVSVCESMHPSHPGVQAQPGPAPYIIKANATTFRNGQPVAVQIEGPDHQGLMLQARANGSTTPLGSWINPPPNTRLLECANNPSGAVTHANTTPKTKNTTYIWMPPDSNCPSAIMFVATVAESFQIYFVGIKSAEVQRDPEATCDSSRAAAGTPSSNTTSNWTSTTATPSNLTATMKSPPSTTSGSTETLSTWLCLLLAGHLVHNLY